MGGLDASMMRVSILFADSGPSRGAGCDWAASRRAEVGVVARELAASAQLQDARPVSNLRGACGCGSDFLSMSRGARFASGKIGRQGVRGNAVFLTARQTGLWLLDADSGIRDSVYERPRLNHSIYRGRNHSTYHVERTVATLNCHQ